MSRRTWSFIALAWLLSLVSVATYARSQTPPPVRLDEVLLSGDDIGFRVEGVRGGRPTGRLVVRFKGRWVEPGAVFEQTPLGSR